MEIGSLLLSTIGKIKVSQVLFLHNGKLMFLFLLQLTSRPKIQRQRSSNIYTGLATVNEFQQPGKIFFIEFFRIFNSILNLQSQTELRRGCWNSVCPLISVSLATSEVGQDFQLWQCWKISVYLCHYGWKFYNFRTLVVMAVCFIACTLMPRSFLIKIM